jgi:hypothetical protein
LNHIKS